MLALLAGIPRGYPSLRPYLFVDDAAAALEFYRKAFGAKERMRLTVPGGKIAHSELEIGDSVIMLCDPLPQSCRGHRRNWAAQAQRSFSTSRMSMRPSSRRSTRAQR